MPTQADDDPLLAGTEKMAEIRLRLFDVFWFMRAFFEPITRRANKEDGGIGHHWEGRIKPKRLLDGEMRRDLICNDNGTSAAVARALARRWPATLRKSVSVGTGANGGN